MKNTIRVIGGCLVMVLSTPALANTGFYAGVGGGYNTGSTSVSSDLNQVFGVANAAKNTDLAIKGFQGSLIAGWGMPFYNRQFYSGIELSADLSNTRGNDIQSIGGDANLDALQSNLSLKQTYGTTLSLKNGVFIDPEKFIYIKVGTAVTNWSFSGATDFLINLHKETQRQDKSSNLLGFKAGIGGQFVMTDDIDVGFEYNYAIYPKMDLKLTASTGEVASHKVNPRVGSFMVMMIKKI